MTSPQARLLDLFRAAVAAADPRARTAEAVRALGLSASVGVVAVGKAARSMVAGAVEACGPKITLALAVTESAQDAPWPVHVHVGDHPVPGARSERAASAIESAVPTLRSLPDVIVLVSGGTTSLVAAPVHGVTTSDLQLLFTRLLASGLAIDQVNAVRRRFLRWGAGRLAASLAPARVHCLIVSDVMSGDLAAIGSGPCVGDPCTAADVRSILSRVRDVPRSCLAYVDAVDAGRDEETPKPGSNSLRHATARVIFDNRTAVDAVRTRAAAHGLRERPAPVVILSGEAHACGSKVGLAATQLAPGEFFVAGGETTVTLPTPHGEGGRCQQLALAAARELQGLPCALLAAGTDGRDGPTDAAGAVVDGGTWARVPDGDASLARCDAYSALGAAGALVRIGPTGTNVNDLVIAMG